MEDQRLEAVRRICSASAQTLLAVAMLLGEQPKPEASQQELTSLVMKKLREAEGEEGEEKILRTIEKLTEQKQLTPKPEVNLSSALRRELKISGAIDGTETGLSFISVMRQIEGAQKRGYPEQEIIDAVISAMPMGHHLRSFLEASSFNLEKIKELLRQHLRQPSTTELFSKLTQSVQLPNESGSDFVLRLMDLRERTKLSAAAKDAGVFYPSELVDQMFKQALSTGFRDIELRLKVQELIKEQNSDVDIIAQVNAVESQTRDRATKSAHCNQVQVGGETDVATAAVTKLTGVMEQLVARIEVLERQDKNQSQRDQQTRNRYKCRHCTQNKIARCQHCWRCGSGTHYERDCDKNTKNAQNQGNGHVSR
jgi:hypothetical protein